MTTPHDLTERVLPWQRLAAAVLRGSWKEVERRRPDGGWVDMRKMQQDNRRRIFFHSYLSAVRSLIHPAGLWTEFLVDIEKERVAQRTAAMLIHIYGRERAMEVARWAMEGAPPYPPEWWHEPSPCRGCSVCR